MRYDTIAREQSMRRFLVSGCAWRQQRAQRARTPIWTKPPNRGPLCSIFCFIFSNFCSFFEDCLLVPRGTCTCPQLLSYLHGHCGSVDRAWDSSVDGILEYRASLAVPLVTRILKVDRLQQAFLQGLIHVASFVYFLNEIVQREIIVHFDWFVLRLTSLPPPYLYCSTRTPLGRGLARLRACTSKVPRDSKSRARSAARHRSRAHHVRANVSSSISTSAAIAAAAAAAASGVVGVPKRMCAISRCENAALPTYDIASDEL